jgi:replication initiator protein RepSA
MLGFRGHFSTKSRAYSTTLGALRTARANHVRAQRASQLPHGETVLVVTHWRFVGLGHLDDAPGSITPPAPDGAT